MGGERGMRQWRKRVGALALAVADRVLMLENAVYAILSPEGFASILWKDAQRAGEAAGLMKLTARELLELGVVDGVIPEPVGGAHTAPAQTMLAVDRALRRQLADLTRENSTTLIRQRYEKFRRMGSGKEEP